MGNFTPTPSAPTVQNFPKWTLDRVFREPFGSWTSAAKIVDVRTRKCVFLQPRWWREVFDPWASGHRAGKSTLWTDTGQDWNFQRTLSAIGPYDFRSGNSQKNPRVRKIFCPQFWGGKCVRQYYGRLEKCVLSAGKTHVHKIPRFRGGVFWVLGGGGWFYFHGRADFSEIHTDQSLLHTFSWGNSCGPPKGPFRTVFSTEYDSVVFCYSVVNLLRIVIQ